MATSIAVAGGWDRRRIAVNEFCEMRVLHAISGLPKAAGTSVFCAEVCNGLVRVGHDVTIAVCDPNAKDSCRLDSRVKLVSVDLIIDSTRYTEFDLVHIHALWEPVLQRINKWAHRGNVPVVWSPHGMLTPWALNNKKWKKRLAWWLYQKRGLAAARLLHATAASELEDIKRVGLKNDVVVVPLGVDVNDCVEHGKHVEGKKVLLFVSRVQKKKGLMNLVEAWARLPREAKQGWCVRIVGPDQEGHTEELKVRCGQLGALDDFAFVGPKFGEALVAEYAASDLFVLPTHSENFGSVVIEALSYDVPVICTKGAPWSELETYNCGKWIDIGVEPLVVALKAMMSLSDEDRRRMGVNGRQLVEMKYTWGAVVKGMVKGYEHLMI